MWHPGLACLLLLKKILYLFVNSDLHGHRKGRCVKYRTVTLTVKNHVIVDICFELLEGRCFWGLVAETGFEPVTFGL